MKYQDFPFTKISYLHHVQWRYYFYLSCVRILVSPWLLTWLANYKRASHLSFELSFTKWLQGVKTVQLTVTFSMSCQIFTSILFPSLKNILEDLQKSRKVMLKNLLRGGGTQTLNKKTLYDLKLDKTFPVEECHKIREIEKIPLTELDSYLSQFVLAARTKTGKIYEPSSLCGILANVECQLSCSSYGKTIFKDSDFKKNKRGVESKTKATQAIWTWKQTKSHNSSYGQQNWDSFRQKVPCIKFTASSVKYYVAKQHDSLRPSLL